MLVSSNITNCPAPTRAFLSDDEETILRFAADGVLCGIRSALVTLVDIRGGAARAVGAQMAVHESGKYCGFISGGCTEAAVAYEAVEAIRTGQDRFLSLGAGSPFIDILLPCGGGITLAIHIVRDANVIGRALDHLSQRHRTAIGYNPEAQKMELVEHGDISGWSNLEFIRVYRPKPRVILYGRGIEASTTARLASVAGYDVVECQPKDHLPKIDADTAIALLLHDLDDELDVLALVLSSDAFYIGALGSSRTHQKRCDALARRGYSAKDTKRIRAPIGLIPKARDARTVAISVLAEIATVLANGDRPYQADATT